MGPATEDLLAAGMVVDGPGPSKQAGEVRESAQTGE